MYLQLKKEFNMLAPLDHENIIKYYALMPPKESEIKNKVQFGVIMEHMPGGSLRSLCK
jgi:serine/threonine protein kinase